MAFTLSLNCAENAGWFPRQISPLSVQGSFAAKFISDSDVTQLAFGILTCGVSIKCCVEHAQAGCV